MYRSGEDVTTHFPAILPSLHADVSDDFNPIAQCSPELILPHPKAPAGKILTNNRRSRKFVILTDTAVKNALEEEQQKRSKVAIKKKKTCRQKLESDEEQDSFCLVCLEGFSNSKGGEIWVLRVRIGFMKVVQPW
ncbi:hypothetical protein SNE40_015976 [Patella caerulea]|uniref:Uncharacterized protein n=1 Tax=Patella caerulea TaxID=87958 RepID=A0AAN8JA09_PATCE